MFSFLDYSYRVSVSDGYFYQSHPTPLWQWFHLALVFNEPEESEGINLYYNGIQVANDNVERNRLFSKEIANMTIGRRYTDFDSNYASVLVDELMLWNHQPSPSQISLLTDKDDCPQMNPCQNEGVCVDGVGSYHCDCHHNYTGEHCEDVNNCPEEYPCENDGVCIDGENTYECSCPTDVRGNYCEEG